MKRTVPFVVVVCGLLSLCIVKTSSAQAPSVDNGAGASSITTNSVVLNGNLTAGIAGNNNLVVAYWGPTDGNTNAVSWSNSVSMGLLNLGPFSTNITGLATNTTYYYRCYASNADDTAWAASTTNFTTLHPDADDDGMLDTWEVANFGDTTTANASTDWDNDDLRDVLEFQNGTDPKVADTDADGFNDYVEFINGASPTNAISKPILPYKQFSRIWGSTNYDTCSASCIDSNGNVYAAGWTSGSFDGQTNAGSNDLWVTKFASSGMKLWTRIWGSVGTDYGEDVCVDGTGSVIVAGVPWGSFDGQTNIGGQDLCVTKFASNGTKLWTRIWGSAGYDSGMSACVDGLGNIHVTGHTSGPFDGQTNAGMSDLCVTKFASDGTKLWTRIWGSASNDGGNAACMDGSGNLYVAGYTYGSFDGQTNAGMSDLCITKCLSDGTRLWTRIWGSTDHEGGNAVCLDGSGNMYVAGYTFGSFDGQTNMGGVDLCVTKFASDGTRLWTRIWGSTSNDYGASASVDEFGNVYVTGYAGDSFDGQTNAGGLDLCVTKFASDGTKLWTRIWGANGDDSGSAVSVDGFGGVYVAGRASGSVDGQTNVGSSDLCMTKWFDPAPMVVENLVAANITTNSAIMWGALVTGHLTNMANVSIYWGLADGGTNALSWSGTNSLGAIGAGVFSTNVTGLAANTTYYYRCFASNDFGAVWAASTTNFTTDRDLDSDGILDSWELANFGSTTNVNASTDWDNDGLSDLLECQNGGNPLVEDSDADGMPDFAEWVAGTTMSNAQSRFEITNSVHAAEEFTMAWESFTGRFYSVLSKTNLMEAGWITNLPARRPGVGGMMTFTNSEEDIGLFLKLQVENE